MNRYPKFVRFLCLALAILLPAFAALSPTASAAETTDTTTSPTWTPFQATDSYVLAFGSTSGASEYAYFSPFVPLLTYDNTEVSGYSILFGLKNTYTGEISEIAYCTDMPVDAVDANYQRLNLTDSSYAAGHANKLRAIVLNSYPHTSLDSLIQASGINGLTVCEAITGTQLAIWKSAHGDIIQIKDFLYTANAGYSSGHSEPSATERSNYINGTDEYKAAVKGRIQALYEYLMALPGQNATSSIISTASFTQRSTAPTLSRNNDGSYNVTVSATVDIPAGSNVTLTAHIGGGYWYAQTSLSVGTNSCTLTIANVPAAYAFGAVTLSIDGTQDVGEDVFLLDAEGIRGTSQSMIAPMSGTAPVHAELKAEPDRILNIHKTANGDPLANISFEIYYVGSLEEYANRTLSIGSSPTSTDISTYATTDRLVGTITTDSNGNGSLNFHTDDGVYLVRELPNDLVVDSVSFFAVLPDPSRSDDNGNPLYTLSVAPKNTLKDTPTGSIQLQKRNASGEPLAGAHFCVYRLAQSNDLSANNLVSLPIGDTTYRMVPVSFYTSSDLTGEKTQELISNDDGMGYIYGLAYGDYYLWETQAPTGYNALREPIKFTISATSHQDEQKIIITNTAGTELPETGGPGTVWFSCGGLLLMSIAFLLLRRRIQIV